MRRERRRYNKDQMDIKRVVYILGGVVLLSIIAFFAVSILNTGNQNNSEQLAKFNTSILDDYISNNTDITEETSSGMGKTKNEVQNEEVNDIEEANAESTSENNVNVENGDKRFLGIFGYANTTGILMLIISIIAIGKYLTSSNKHEKIIFNIVIFINISTIIMSYSRATWIISIVIYLGYLLFLKKEDNIKYIELIIRTRNNKCNIQYNNHKIHKSRKRLVCMDAVSDIYSNYIFK